MTTDAFEKAFGATHAAQADKPTFAEKLGRGAPAAPTPQDPTETSVETGNYKPYGFLPTSTVGETCDIQRWLGDTQVAEGIEFQYRFLMQIGYVGEEEIRLFLPDCIVVIEGKHLRDLRKKLARRQVTFIQQFSPKIWPQRPPAGEPIVEKIQVVRPKSE